MSDSTALRVLVTGASGFVGRHLVAALDAAGCEVWTAGRDVLPNGQRRTVPFRLEQPKLIQESIRLAQPNVVVHLAAQSNVKKSWADPSDTILLNTVGTLRLMDAIQAYVPGTKLLTIGSSEEYGMVLNRDAPISEEELCNPQNPYALSKYCIGQSVIQRMRSGADSLVHVRPFNHFGPGQGLGFVVSDFASQVASIEAGIQKPVIEVGNLDAIRDFTDVRDVVGAYVRLIQSDVPPGIYNVCSSRTVKISDILQTLVALSTKEISVVVHPDKLRPVDVPMFIGSYSKLHAATGWKPRRNVKDSLEETLNWWRERVSQEGGC